MKKLDTVLSPATGKPMRIVHELREVTFRKETFRYVATFWQCPDSGEEFTEGWMDEVSLSQVYNQYRAKYGIPFTDEIRRIREDYGLSAAKMSVIMGFGDNQYRLYENGEMPSLSNGRILRSVISNPETFRSFVEASREQLSQKDCSALDSAIDAKRKECNCNRTIRELIFGTGERSSRNGYAPMNLERLQSVMSYLIENADALSVSKMNIILFYLDMYSYRERGIAITGLSYMAAPNGPMPEHWSRAFSLTNGIEMEMTCHPDDTEKIELKSTAPYNPELFSDMEKECLQAIAQKFRNTNPSALSELSRSDSVWKNAFSNNSPIDFTDALLAATL